MALQISDTTPRIQYTATSGQTTFAVNFEFFDVADLKVYNGTTLLTYNNSPSSASQYSVTGAGVTGGGSITLGSPGATLNDSITIVRDLAIERLSDFPVSGNFPIQTLNSELDKIVAMLQQLEEQFARTLQYPVTTTTGFDVDLPELVANRVLSVNADATALLAEQELGTFQGDWAASTSYQVRDLVKDTSNGNIYFVNAAHTSSGSEPLSSNTNSSKYDLIVDAAAATSSATNAANSATAAANSATAAASSATDSENSATDAETAQTAAEAAQSAAETAQTAAETAETNAETAETNASNSASTASTQATNASNSASAAATSATNASNSASAASTSESNAASSASAASTSASNASTSETNAATSASNASTSETNAATSATNASNAQTAAETAQAAAEAAADSIDDTYLGAKASNPTVDNDGDPLTVGDWYFNTTSNQTFIYNGSSWDAIAPDLIGDTTPQLGGNLDLNSNDITGTGNINITGTVTSDGLTVNGVESPMLQLTDLSTSNSLQIYADNGGGVIRTSTDDDLFLRTNSLNRLKLDNAGDISFYEDTGTTPKLFWDASEERLGIGVTDPDSAIEVQSSASGVNSAHLSNTSSGGYGVKFVGGGNTSTQYIADFRDYSGASKVKIDGDGNVGIGTSSPSEELHIYKNTTNSVDLKLENSEGSATLKANNDSLYLDADIHVFRSEASSEYMRIDSSGEIGIGTGSPSAELHISKNADAGNAEFLIENSFTTAGSTDETVRIQGRFGGYDASYIVTGKEADFTTSGNRSSFMSFWTRGAGTLAERMRIDSSGNVGIGTSSPSASLEVQGSSTIVKTYGSSFNNQVHDSVAGAFSQSTYQVGGVTTGLIGANASNMLINTGANASADIIFATGSGTTERMRINSSGNVLVGKTSINATVVGGEIRVTGALIGVTDGANVLQLNRKTSNGKIARFDKDGTEAGNIGALNTELYIGSNSGSGSYLNFGNNRIIPANSSGGNRDNIIDLGNSGSRFDDIFATNGTIQTSDQNEKQSIQSLTASEMAVAQRISKLFKTFKWNSAVEEKGDSARTHTGIIAQDVQQAFVDEGLDASNYALFISSTWWEKEISVDAVVEELDEEGNVLVEGKDAYTYIETKEEATEGYTERTRLGIRYPELLSFVSSAFEQRLTNIETRLTALET